MDRANVEKTVGSGAIDLAEDGEDGAVGQLAERRVGRFGRFFMAYGAEDFRLAPGAAAIGRNAGAESRTPQRMIVIDHKYGAVFLQAQQRRRTVVTFQGRSCWRLPGEAAVMAEALPQAIGS